VSAQLIERLLEQRRTWIPLGDGRRRVRICRPAATELHTLVGGVTADVVCKYVDAWEGFTEADILGDAAGSDTPVTFSAELFDLWARDHVDVIRVVAEGLLASVTALMQRQADTAKN
jgi:hypothetical protein